MDPQSETGESSQANTKRGRKPKDGASAAPKTSGTSKQKKITSIIFSDKMNEGDGGTDPIPTQQDDENIVLNLKVFNASKDMNFNGIAGIDDDNGPFLSRPFEFDGGAQLFDTNNCDINDDDAFSECNQSTCASVINAQESSGNTQNVNGLKVVELLKDFEEKNKHNEWPSNTSIHCYWCCHRFNNTPFGIPIKYTHSRFHVYGCFCSLECAYAYNLDSKVSSDDIWERASLINMLARKLGYKTYIKPAPSKLSLATFGGHMEIEEFRNYCSSNKIMNINFPPMLTMTQQIEEIYESDVNNDYRYIPIDTDRINKYKEKIKLKRNKPITNYKNTLDHTMNIKYGNTELEVDA